MCYGVDNACVVVVDVVDDAVAVGCSVFVLLALMVALGDVMVLVLLALLCRLWYG